jgi:hypothetical protein
MTDDIYGKLKGQFSQFLTQQDLIPFCDSVKIPRDELPALLAPYGVSGSRVSRRSWKSFFENEFCAILPSLPVPPNLSPTQVGILRNFTSSIRAKSAPTLQSQWTLVAKRNPAGSHPCQMRLSALCHFVTELSLVMDPATLIDAILAFFGEPLESLDFGRFARLMQTFN